MRRTMWRSIAKLEGKPNAGTLSSFENQLSKEKRAVLQVLGWHINNVDPYTKYSSEKTRDHLSGYGKWSSWCVQKKKKTTTFWGAHLNSLVITYTVKFCRSIHEKKKNFNFLFSAFQSRSWLEDRMNKACLDMTLWMIDKAVYRFRSSLVYSRFERCHGQLK